MTGWHSMAMCVLNQLSYQGSSAGWVQITHTNQGKKQVSQPDNVYVTSYISFLLYRLYMYIYVGYLIRLMLHWIWISIITYHILNVVALDMYVHWNNHINLYHPVDSPHMYKAGSQGRELQSVCTWIKQCTIKTAQIFSLRLTDCLECFPLA
jgi:hypothetical protein